MVELGIKLTQEEVDLVLVALANTKATWNEINPLIFKIRNQALEQLQESPEKEVKEVKKAKK